jgi:hypothetical protein
MCKSALEVQVGQASACVCRRDAFSFVVCFALLLCCAVPSAVWCAVVREPKFSLLMAGNQFTLCERDGFFKVTGGGGGRQKHTVTTSAGACCCCAAYMHNDLRRLHIYNLAQALCVGTQARIPVPCMSLGHVLSPW